MTEMTWKARKLAYLKDFEKKYEEWKVAVYNDDRNVYVNIYRMIYEAVNSFPEEPPLYVRVAMHKYLSEDMQTLERIRTHFAE